MGDSGGEPLPTVFPSLAAAGTRFRRSELALIAAEPGVGKSIMAVTLARGAGVPTLYLSADSSARTQAVRMLSAQTGWPQYHFERMVDREPDKAAAMLKQSSHIKWCFDSAPSLEDVELEVHAFEAMFGEPPHLLIIDNATDVGGEQGEEFSALRALMRDLKCWAREYDSAVVALHHVNEYEPPKDNPPICPPRRMIQGKVSQIAALVLTLSSTDGWLHIATVKNRYGPYDKSGHTAVSLPYLPERMVLSDPMDRRTA